MFNILRIIKYNLIIKNNKIKKIIIKYLQMNLISFNKFKKEINILNVLIQQIKNIIK